jgi:3D (Asp-Asp-Asp) domain-containing protein
MQMIRLLGVALLAMTVISCESTGLASRARGQKIGGVKTTAYTHSEADHIVHGSNTATGLDLKYGHVRSAAADWSVYPVGTVFQIDGDPYVYQIDDYGSALVGTNTIDLYKPSKQSMNDWGARNVNISVIKWGSFRQSLAIMKPRAVKSPHVSQMVKRIETSS